MRHATGEIGLPAFTLEPPPKVITFDCYGTLVQWREVLLAGLARLVAARGRTGSVEPTDLLATFSRHSRRLEADRPHRLYKQVLRAAFRAALDEHGLAPTDAEIEALARSIVTMGPHPEVPAVLRRLRERYRLAIITNSDDDLIAHNVALLGVPIDHVITAEQAGAYKPSSQIFDHAHRSMGVRRAETIHVAMGMFLDMQACHEFQIRAVWINRLREQGNPDWLPYAELPDLAGVPDLLLPDDRLS